MGPIRNQKCDGQNVSIFRRKTEREIHREKEKERDNDGLRNMTKITV